MPNLTDQFTRSTIAIMIADPPRPECEPSKDDIEARDSAQASTRLLTQAVSESGLNTDGVYETALDVAGTYGSGFVEVCYDPKGGGLQPMTIAARVGAMTEEEAVLGDGPMTRKFVMPDGTLSDSSAGAKKQWQPKVQLHVLHGNQLRFLPRMCQGIEDAQGVVIIRYESFGKLASMYERVRSMTPEDQWVMCQWHPNDKHRIIPPDLEYQPVRDPDTSVTPPDDYPVATVRVYYRSHEAYPYGCRAVFAGNKFRLEAKPLMAQTPDGNGGMQDQLMSLPVAQFRWRRQEGNPYGQTDVEIAGPMDEQRAAIFVGRQERAWKANRPRAIMPFGTTIQPEEWSDWEKPLQAPPGGKPEWFPLAPDDGTSVDMIERLKAEMMEVFGITPISLGQVAGSVRSAEQQKTAIEQSVVALSSKRASFEDGYERMHRLILEAYRAYWDVPMLLQYQTDDGAYQVESLLREDLGNTSAVRVRRGSGTMLSATAKNDLIMQQAQIMGPQEATRLLRDNLAPLVGLRDEPATKRIKRQLHRWRKGPEPEVAQAKPQPQIDPATGQPAIDPMTGQPVMVDPVAQAAAAVFEQLPVDDEQTVAALQHAELLEAVSEMDMHAHPPAWNQALVQRYLYARQAAGIMTVMEQQQQAAQQQQAQAQQAQQEQEGKRAEKQEDRAHEAKEREASSEAEMQREQMRAAARSQMPQTGA
ncbi:MAG: hypothetical protein IPK85_03280 [Gemmatimonadetes bacterium]|nr:hypothetical protein [Gemmatimonadota bacterium]